ncbi:hypothetical protein AGDE_13746 [Angomonas deanei]|uniref:Uncharacterized protein n=1 Tax=Angomonas deanei TaxID=59799 RepID=A0A7G2CRD1_9TRYP|nr:hypothetical protein AGDE_13746 [Angomonas deanei]CAD2221707.1 hypothetical protein, conserved [Angomonas deanei]|eukprot:EPY21789.1 hypothetical protein AGDE_13746 [Angomonas deanei]
MATLDHKYEYLRVKDSDEDSDAVSDHPPVEEPPQVPKETKEPEQPQTEDKPAANTEEFKVPEQTVEKPHYVSDGDSSSSEEEEQEKEEAEPAAHAEVAQEEPAAQEEAAPVAEPPAPTKEQESVIEEAPAPTPDEKKKTKGKKEASPEKATKKKTTAKKSPEKKGKAEKKPKEKAEEKSGVKKAVKKKKPEEEKKPKKEAATPAKKTPKREPATQKKEATPAKPQKKTTPQKKNAPRKQKEQRTPRHKREMNSSRRSAPPTNTDDKNRSKRLPDKAATPTPKKRAPRQSAHPQSQRKEPEPGRAMRSDDPVFIQIRGQRRASSTASTYSIRPSISGPFTLVASGQPAPHFAPALETALLDHYINGLVHLSVKDIERVVAAVCAPLDQKPVMNHLKRLQQKRLARRSISTPTQRTVSPNNQGKGWVRSSKIETSSAGASVRRPASPATTHRRRDVVKDDERALENFKFTFGNEVRAVFLEEVATVCLSRRNRFYREQPRMVIERGIVVSDDVLGPFYIQAVNKLLYRMLGWTEQEAQRFSPDVVELIIDELPPAAHAVNAETAAPPPQQTQPQPAAVPEVHEDPAADHLDGESDRVSEPFS